MMNETIRTVFLLILLVAGIAAIIYVNKQSVTVG